MLTVRYSLNNNGRIPCTNSCYRPSEDVAYLARNATRSPERLGGDLRSEIRRSFPPVPSTTPHQVPNPASTPSGTFRTPLARRRDAVPGSHAVQQDPEGATDTSPAFLRGRNPPVNPVEIHPSVPSGSLRPRRRHVDVGTPIPSASTSVRRFRPRRAASLIGVRSSSTATGPTDSDTLRPSDGDRRRWLAHVRRSLPVTHPRSSPRSR